MDTKTFSSYCMFFLISCIFLICQVQWKSQTYITFDLWLPQVDSKELEKSLTQRSFMTATDSVSKVLTSAQAVDGRDAFVKVISHHPY